MRAFRFIAASLLAAIVTVAFADPQPSPKEVNPRAAVPFAVGERLLYSVKWDPPWYLFFLPSMEAGQIDLHLLGETEYKGKKALKISFQVHSSGSLAKMAGLKIDDDFVFFTEPNTFCTLGLSKKIREGKRKRQIDVDYIRDAGQLHIREFDESVEPPQLKKDETKNDIPACVQDPLSAVYFFRLSQLQEKHAQNFLVGHDDRIKEITARVEKHEIVETPAGRFPAWRVTVASLMGGLFKEGGQFKIWVSADEKKMPVQFEFKVRMGRVLGKLVRQQNEQ